MNHHPSCRPTDRDLVWHCNQCGLNELIEGGAKDDPLYQECLNLNAQVAEAKADIIEMNLYVQQAKAVANQLKEAKELLIEQRNLWEMLKPILNELDAGKHQVYFMEFHDPIGKIDSFFNQQ